jgi:hypothetical protein
MVTSTDRNYFRRGDRTCLSDGKSNRLGTFILRGSPAPKQVPEEKTDLDVAIVAAGSILASDTGDIV